jgi:hypothetical protein
MPKQAFRALAASGAVSNWRIANSKTAITREQRYSLKWTTAACANEAIKAVDCWLSQMSAASL